MALWRQGDVSEGFDVQFIYLADLSHPISNSSRKLSKILASDSEPITIRDGVETVSESIMGLVALSQTCDIVRDCRVQPFVEVAPIVKVDAVTTEAIRRLKHPSYVYIPSMSKRGLVADINRVMTVEKAVFAGMQHITGCKTDSERREFAQAIARKWSRFAFPDDFTDACKKNSTKNNRQARQKFR